MEVIVRGL